MSRYIDVEGFEKLFDEEYKATRKLINEGETHLDNIAEGFSEAAKVIRSIPTADVVEVRHGRWVKQKPDSEAMKIIHDMGLGKGMSINSIYWTCSVCENWGTPTHKYCCSCGAKMDGERREE